MWISIVPSKRTSKLLPVAEPEQGGKIQRKPIGKSGSGLTALGIYGLELIEQDLVVQEDEGPLLDSRGIKNVPIRFCGLGVLIGLKAWALRERTKTKDGYDIVWLLKAKGLEEVAQHFVDKGLHQLDFGTTALEILEECFKTHEHTGPVGWITESEFDEEQAAVESRLASGLVLEFANLVRQKAEEAASAQTEKQA